MLAMRLHMAKKAFKTIRETMSGTDIPPGVRLKAALCVLQSGAAMDESTGDAERLQFVEGVSYTDGKLLNLHPLHHFCATSRFERTCAIGLALQARFKTTLPTCAGLRVWRGAGGAGREVCHPHPGQRQPGVGHRGVTDAARRKAELQAGGLVQELSLSGRQLGNLWRLVLPKRIDNWSLTSLQQRLVKTHGRLVKHARYYWLLLAEGHLTRGCFGSMLRRIAALPLPDE
jgi:hypothetical protein